MSQHIISHQHQKIMYMIYILPLRQISGKHSNSVSQHTIVICYQNQEIMVPHLISRPNSMGTVSKHITSHQIQEIMYQENSVFENATLQNLLQL